MSAEWLPEFFSNENQIDLAKVMAGEYGPVYLQMMEPLIQAASENRWPVILPFNDGLLRFYATAQDERLLLELRRVLVANLGSAYTSAELPIIKEATNFSEKVLLKRSPVGLLCITMLESARDDWEAKKQVFAILHRVLFLYAQRPSLTGDNRRPVGRILREFFTACQVFDGKGAENLFQEIKASGSLSQRNLLFLRFQVLAADMQWEAILEHEQLTKCLNGRIPLQITHLLLKALGNRFQAVLQKGFSGIELAKARQECQVLAPLFRKSPFSVELKNVTDEWKVWAIGAALYGFPDIARHIPTDIESSWLNDLFTWIGVENLEQGVEHEEERRQDLIKLNLQRAKELLQYSLVASSEELREIIIDLSSMPEEVAVQIEKIPSLHQYWLTLQRQNSPRHYGWSQWFVDICERKEKAEELRQLAMSECQEWPVSSFDADAILNVLETCGYGETGEAFRDVIPLMLSWLHSRNITCKDLFWVKLLELLALDNIANQQDVQLAGSLLEALLGNSYSVDSYKDALQAVEIILEKVNSTKCYGAVLELMDLLLDNPCPSATTLQSLWQTVQRFAINKWHRLSPLLRQLTIFSAREVLGEWAENTFSEIMVQGNTEVIPEEQFPDLTGKVLAIYTLTENAARRAKEILESLFRGISIKLNHDHVATSALENLAKKAEYFIFAANSAKHQAYYAVTNIRNDVIYPQGKGATSIVRAFVSQIHKDFVAV